MTAIAPARRGFALPGRGRGEEPEWTVLLTVAIALLLGLVVQAAVTGASTRVDVSGMSLSYPAKWAGVRDPGALFSARDLFGGATSARVSVYEVGTTVDGDAGTAAGGWTVGLADRHLGYHTIGTRRESVGGRAATQIEYVYIQTRAGSAPVLMRGIDTVATAGGKAYALSFVAPSERFDELATRQFPRFGSTFHGILASWKLP